jgi:hypothetical protein
MHYVSLNELQRLIPKCLKCPKYDAKRFDYKIESNAKTTITEKMERVVQIGIYEYINETFPTSKDNKVLYFSIFMKRPQFLEAHMEWLYNNKYVFLGWEMQSTDEVWARIRQLNEEENEDYMKYKYSTGTICRSRSEDCTVEEEIEHIGLYSHIDIYGGNTGNKLKLYYEMINDDIMFNAHCKSLSITWGIKPLK